MLRFVSVSSRAGRPKAYCRQRILRVYRGCKAWKIRDAVGDALGCCPDPTSVEKRKKKAASSRQETASCSLGHLSNRPSVGESMQIGLQSLPDNGLERRHSIRR